MKAPDKIYLNIPGDYWHTEDCDRTVNDIEYVRKNALLDWLKKECEIISWYYKKMQHVTGSVGNNDTAGKLDAYKKVIDKIESL